MAGIKKNISYRERFLDCFEKTAYCWNWKKYLDSSGRGYIRKNKKKYIASRASYEFFIGKIPNKLHVLHKCDNPKCVNPDHLFLGTNLDNVKDKIKKGRQLKGQKVWSNKLKTDDVIHIFYLRKEKKITHREIASIYKVSRSLITMILGNKRWCHLSQGGDLSQPHQ